MPTATKFHENFELFCQNCRRLELIKSICQKFIFGSVQSLKKHNNSRKKMSYERKTIEPASRSGPSFVAFAVTPQVLSQSLAGTQIPVKLLDDLHNARKDWEARCKHIDDAFRNEVKKVLFEHGLDRSENYGNIATKVCHHYGTDPEWEDFQ